MDERSPWETAIAQWSGEASLAPWFAFGRLGIPITELSCILESVPDGVEDALMAGYVEQLPDPAPTIFANLYVGGRNPDLAEWPEDEKLARAALLLDMIEAANDEVERIIPAGCYRGWDIENVVTDAREWLDERATGEATETKGEGDERCSSKATTAERVPD